MADEAWLSDDEQRAWRSYMDMQHMLGRHLDRHLQQEFGLSVSDFEILVNLSESPSGRMRAFELGRVTQWEKSRMSHHLRRMEKRGLIRKELCDGRYPEIVLTEVGRDAINASAPANAARVRKLFIEVLGADRLSTLREAADDVVDAVNEHLQTDCSPEVRGA